MQIADEELEASSISLPMVCARGFTLNRMARLMVRAIKSYLKKSKRNRNTHLQVIKIVGEDTKMLISYMSTIQDTFQDIVKTFCEPRKIHDEYEEENDRPYSCDYSESYVPSFKSENHLTLHYSKSSREYHMEE